SYRHCVSILSSRSFLDNGARCLSVFYVLNSLTSSDILLFLLLAIIRLKLLIVAPTVVIEISILAVTPCLMTRHKFIVEDALNHILILF
ncbi:MAG: hypothetical protein ACMG6E_02960, partial [Candidatus Roizmanbacteria bacterium]